MVEQVENNTWHQTYVMIAIVEKQLQNSSLSEARKQRRIEQEIEEQIMSDEDQMNKLEEELLNHRVQEFRTFHLEVSDEETNKSIPRKDESNIFRKKNELFLSLVHWIADELIRDIRFSID